MLAGRARLEVEMEIGGKTALVTGGAHRLGKAIALGLAQAGANVVINYHRSASAAEETAAEVHSLGVGVLTAQADVADSEQVEAIVAAARQQFGGIDILVNGASLWQKTPFPMENYGKWQRVSRILVDGPLYCANAVAPAMLARGEGAIVNIVDLSAWQPWPGYAAHSVGKSALLALTRQLAVELAPAVQVNAVAPGPVLPPLDCDPEAYARMAAGTLKGRWGTPQDVVGAVLFLARSSYITGEVIVVDGGQRFGHHRTDERG